MVEDGKVGLPDQQPLAAFSDPLDAEQALILARHYHSQCVIGRPSAAGRYDPSQPTFTFWR